ncbi:acetyl-CoA synthetase-like protein [Basidiobolus meristosporus CBS 931.73]|uniref:Acetyl-CoA synthetase-like protein n=1 Tax=Basidiobolus meristosporus CBS 931.73 TaxID=1314790 RepID=A0A1Y1WTU0_9FUNG|nr:acetyl-CoA synthetase-like protein [Basidiobolus meristosporus CBS 931.73]|eukprot:ORX76564.1 acetyl-CoA synthetase-like protein [Basidiobolus meristosporus CBS 931.73]
MQQALQSLDEALNHAPNTSVGDLEILPTDERHLLIQSWNDTDKPCPHHIRVHQLFENQVDQTPDAIAVVYRDQALTFRELNARANWYAQQLKALGIQPGDFIATLLKRSTELIVMQIAILKVGAAYVPIDPKAPADRQAFIIDDCAARLLVTTENTQIPSVLNTPLLRLSDNPDSTDIIIDAPNVISSGIPKGVLVPHRAIVRLTINNGYANVGPDDRVAFAANPAFDAMLFNQFVLSMGSTLAKLRYLLCGGEQESLESFATLLKYGGLSTSSIAMDLPRPQRLPLRRLPIGRPISKTSVYVLDQHGHPVPLGVVGELYIGGTGVANGYLNRADLSAERFLPDPFSTCEGNRMYRTGDLVRFLPDGNLVFSKSVDSVLNSAKLKLVLLSTPLVNEVAVLAIGNGADKRLVAYVVAEQSEGLAHLLHSHVAEKLPDYMTPTAYVRMDRLPLTANGKLDRRALPEPDRELPLSVRHTNPCGRDGNCLGTHLGGTAQHQTSWRHDNFFMLGGHSLLAVQLIERLRRIGLGLSVRALFDTPTLSVIAQSLNRDRVAVAASAVAPPNLITPDTTEITPEMLPLIDLTQDDIDHIVNQVEGGVSNIQDIYALAPLQDGMLFHHIMATKGDPYLIFGIMAFADKHILTRYLDAVQKVVDRHDILRTGIMWEGLSTPAQVVLRHATLSVTELVLNPADGSIVEQLTKRVDPREHRIDLTQAPLTRFITAQDIDGRWIAAHLLHHAIGDHSAADEMNHEIEAILDGRADLLPAPSSFRNLIAQARVGHSVEAHERFFTEMLSEIETPALPFGLSDVHGNGHNITEAYCLLPQGLNNRLRSQAKSMGVSLASICHLAWAQVIARTSGQQQVVFGTVLFGRMQAGSGADRAMGLYINTLPIRIDVDNASVQDTVRQTQASLAALMDHEHASLALAQRCSSVPSGIPMFSALLNYRHNKQEPTNDTGIPGIEYIEGQERTNYPFLMSVEDNGTSLGVTAQIVQPYDSNRIINYMQQALQSIADALEFTPMMPINELDVLPIDERNLVLDTWNITDGPYPDHLCVHQLFEEQVSRSPNAIAVVSESQTLTYSEVNERANRLAHHLIELGVKPDTLVALCVERSVAIVIGILAILKAGGAYLPLDPVYASERLNDIVSDASPSILLADEHGSNTIGEASLASLTVVDPNAQFEEHPATNPQVTSLTSHHLAYVIYTSGSTGKPKGVMVEHAQVTRLFDATAAWYQFNENDVWCLLHSYSFDFSVWELWGALRYGGKLVLPSHHVTRSSEDLYELICEQGITVLNLTPSAFKPLIACHAQSELQDQLRYVIFGGEALEPAILQPWYATRSEHSPKIVNMYGITETTVHVTYRVMKKTDCTQVISPIGSRIPDLTTYILDTRGNPVPMGVVGELYIGGAGVTRGYLNRPELTAERFPLDPFSKTPGARMYRTGDLGRYQSDGSLIFLGRNDHQVKIRGFRIELGEIEARLVDHPLVKEAAVLAVGDDSDKRLVAYVVAAHEEELAHLLRSHVAEKLPDYMIPTAFVRMDKLPLTANGKLDRRALPEPDSDSLVSQKYEAPVGEIETALAAIWEELLQINRVGRHDNFFMLGGHSLLAVQLIERLRRIGLVLPIRALFNTPTLSILAQSLNCDRISVAAASMIPPNLIKHETTEITPEMLPLIDLTQSDIDRIVSQVEGGVSNIQDIYALAPLQDGMLFHHIMSTKGDPYLLISALAFDSRAVLDRYLGAVQKVVDRHDILRTGIMWEGLSTPAQVVLRHATLSFTELSLNSSDGSIVEQLKQRFDPREHSIDLTQAPLLRYVAAQDDDGRWIVIQLMHHIIDDNTSVQLMYMEIQAFMDGEGDSLPSPQPFRNLIAQARAGPNVEAHERFFTQMLGEIDTPALPFGLSDVHNEGLGITETHLRLPQDLNDRLREHAKSMGVSLASLCHLAWAQVIARTSGQHHVVFGTVLFGRMNAGSGLRSTMGPFINTLPLRIDVGSDSVQDTVRKTHTSLAALMEHEYASLALAQRCSSVASGTPMFSAILNYRHHNQVSSEETEIAGIEYLEGQERTNYPFGMSVEDFGDALGVTAQIVEPFDSVRIAEYMQQSLLSLADALELTPSMPAQEMEVVPVDERNMLLYSWNATDMDYPDQMCIHHLFEEHAIHSPDSVAIVYESQTLTYAEVNACANRLAHLLIDRGVKPDTLVAICMERSPALVVALLAILKAGGAYVPLDPSYASERLRDIISDARPVILIADTLGRTMLGSTVLSSVTLLDPHTYSDYPSINPQVPELNSHHLAYVIYTSGSTGKPKGVMVEHQGFVSLIKTRADVFGIRPTSRVMQFFSFSFDGGALEMFNALGWGACLHLLPDYVRLHRVLLWDYLERYSITQTILTPAMLQDCSSLPPLTTSLTLIMAGEALPITLLRTLQRLIPNGRIINDYGPTETTVSAIAWKCPPDFSGNIVPIGRAISNKRVYLLDAFGQPVPLGAVGEMYIGGVGVARGYLNRPELTAQSFLADPFSDKEGCRMYKTGDLARYLPDGNLEYLGRNDHQIKIRGFRIEPGEIEARLVDHPLVKEAAVLALGEGTEKRLVAYVVAEHKEGLAHLLRTHVAEKLPDYMTPAAFVRLDELPLTPNGKLDRRALPEPDSSSLVSQKYEAPVGEVETALAAIWEELLSIERVGRHDNFFMLGGHSLLAVRLMNRVSVLGIQLQLTSLFASPILSDLANVITKQLSQKEQVFDSIMPVSRGAALMPSFAQQRLWFLAQIEGVSDIYHMPMALRLRGTLDQIALQRALNTVFSRHESLRSIFITVDGQPRVQLLPANLGIGMSAYDIRGEPDMDKRLQELSAVEASAPFNLETGPLVRAKLIQLAHNDHVFLLTQHHIVSDGWSMGLLTRELSDLYTAFHNGLPDPLAPLTLQYPDYAAWQRKWLSGDRLQEQSEFWRNALAGAPVSITLPTDRPRPSRQSFAGARMPIRVDSHTTLALKRLSQQNGATLFMTILAAWSAVLSRLSGQDDIMIGTPSANRNHRAIEQLIGFFVNTLVLRVDLSGNPSGSELLERVRQFAVAAQAHQDLPFEQVVEITKPPRRMDQTPLFQVMFAWQNNDEGEVHLPGIIISPAEVTYDIVKFDLDLELYEENDEIIGHLGYSTALFEQSTIERHIGYLQAMLQAIATDAGQSVSSVNLLSSSEQKLLIEKWNITDEPYTNHQCIHQLFEEQVTRFPNAIAVVSESQTLTYSEVNERANRLAHHLIELGVKPDTLVALCVERSVAIVIGILAILKAGGAYLPLDPVYASERLNDIVSDASPSILLADEHGGNTIGEASLASLTVVDPNAQFEEHPATNPQVTSLTSHHLAYVIYTSGSTGKPKGVMVEHAQVTRLFDATAAWYQFNENDVWCLLHSYSFDFSVWELWGALRYGGKLVLPSHHVTRSSEDLYELICEQGITVLNLTPSAFKPLIACHAQSELQDQLRYVIFGGEALEPAILQPWYATRSEHSPKIVNMYGITETTVHVTYRVMKKTDCTQAISPIGARIPDLTTYILDTRGNPVPMGVVGELYIGGAGVTRGYLNRPELTAERFPLDPFSKTPGARMYRTGDLGRYQSDGSLIFLGRNDHQVKIRGFRIELGEIEARLVDHPLVKEAAVLAVGDDSDKRLVAYVVAAHEEELAHLLRSHVAEKLPDYMIPTAFVRMDKLPLTANGKLDRRALPEPDSSSLVSQKYEAPVGEIETVLAAIWEELLSIERVGRHDNFFMLGGHSLLAVQLIERLRRIGLGLSVRSLFDTPTLSVLAQSLNQNHVSFMAAAPANLITPGTTEITPEMLPLIDLTQSDIDHIVSQVEGGVSNIQDIYALAPLQDGMLFHHMMVSKGDPYLLISAIAFDSKDVLDRYLGAVQKVVDRHDILRTGIMWEGLSTPAQVVLRHATLSFTELSLNSSDGPIVEQLKQRFDPREHSIDLTQAPLLRYVAAQDDDGRWIVIQLMHHIIDDNTSLKLMHMEIQAFMDGEGDPLPSPQPFRNLIAQARAGPNVEAHERFFTQMLGEIDTPALPFGLSDVHGDGLDITETHLRLPQDLNDRLREHAKSMGVSLASLCHLAWAQVIARTSGQHHVVFGTVLFGRMNAGSGLRSTMGPFINTLPLRIDVGSGSVQDTVRKTHTSLAALMEHEYASLALAQRCSSVASGTPMFSALLNYRHNEQVAVENIGIPGIEYLEGQERTNYPFVMSVEDFGDALGVTAQVVQPFDSVRIAEYMRQALQSLSDALEFTSTMASRELEVMPVDELNLLLRSWNTTDEIYPDQLCIHHLFEQQVSRSPDAVAIVYESVTLTYAEVNACANRLAHHLIAVGVRPDTLVAICVERSPAMVVGLLAILKAGGAYIPLDPVYASERLGHILKDAAPIALLADAAGCAALGKAAIASLTVIDPNEVPDLPATNPHILDLTSEHLAYLIYTSGSTGTPKGVMIPHSGACNYLHWAVQTYAPKQGSVVSSSLSFDATVTSLWTPLLYGSTVTLLKSGDEMVALEAYVRQAQGEGLLKITPAHLDLMGRRLQADGAKTRVDTFVVGGEALSPSTVALWRSIQPGVRIVNEYGPTETVVGCSVYDMSTPLDQAINVPIGRPIANTRLYLLDSHGKPVPLGAVGELHIGGAGVARGYLNRPDLTAERFLPDPFSDKEGCRMYKTGDLARYLPDGNLEYLGRNDHQIKIRGFRIEPGEIEARLVDHPLVKEAAVLALGEGTEKRLVAYVVAEHKEGLAHLLRTYIAEKLPDYMTPAAFVRLDELPLTPNGKLDRRALPEPDSSSLVSQKYEAPVGEIETALAAIWEELLSIERVGRHDNFFMIGGHSLLAVKLIGRIRSSLGFELKLRTIFQAPTIEELVQVLPQQDSSHEDAFNVMLPLKPNGNRSPLFCVHPIFGLSWSFVGLAKHLHADQPLYGIQARGLDGNSRPALTLEDMASDYIDQIRLIQPHGPYNLLGWSFGGTVAHHMAVQLEMQGEKVDLLALMDSRAEAMSTLGCIDENEHDTSYIELLARFGSKYTPGEGQALWETVRNVVRNNSRVSSQYSPSMFSGDILFFSATVPSEETALLIDPNSWAPFVRGKIEVHEVECAHLEMNRPEPMAHIGSVLYSRLEELQQQRNLTA